MKEVKELKTSQINFETKLYYYIFQLVLKNESESELNLELDNTFEIISSINEFRMKMYSLEDCINLLVVNIIGIRSTNLLNKDRSQSIRLMEKFYQDITIRYNRNKGKQNTDFLLIRDNLNYVDPEQVEILTGIKLFSVLSVRLMLEGNLGENNDRINLDFCWDNLIYFLKNGEEMKKEINNESDFNNIIISLKQYFDMIESEDTLNKLGFLGNLIENICDLHNNGFEKSRLSEINKFVDGLTKIKIIIENEKKQAPDDDFEKVRANLEELYKLYTYESHIVSDETLVVK